MPRWALFYRHIVYAYRNFAYIAINIYIGMNAYNRHLCPYGHSCLLTNRGQGFFFLGGGGILVLSPKICLFGGQGFFYAKILLFSTLISFEIYFTFCNRQLSFPFDACFVFSVVFPLFFCQKKIRWTLVRGDILVVPQKKGKKKPCSGGGWMVADFSNL